MGHATALAAARNKLLAERGWDVERRGLAGAPPIRIITGGQQHASIDRAVRLLGLGTDAIINAGADPQGRLDPRRAEPRARIRGRPGDCVPAGRRDQHRIFR